MTAGKLVFTFNTFYINIFFNILTIYSFYITIHDISREAPASISKRSGKGQSSWKGAPGLTIAYQRYELNFLFLDTGIFS